MLQVIFAVAVAAPPSGGAFSPTASFGRECWVAPLEVSLSELAMTGQISEEYIANHCSRWLKGSFEFRPGRTLAVADTRIAHFQLFGERLSFGFTVVVKPGTIGKNDTIYTVPSFDLPDSWEQAIDKATYPALAIAGTAIVTTIIVKALKH